MNQGEETGIQSNEERLLLHPASPQTGTSFLTFPVWKHGLTLPIIMVMVANKQQHQVPGRMCFPELCTGGAAFKYGIMTMLIISVPQGSESTELTSDIWYPDPLQDSRIASRPNFNA